MKCNGICAICQSAAHLLTLASAGHPPTKEKIWKNDKNRTTPHPLTLMLHHERFKNSFACQDQKHVSFWSNVAPCVLYALVITYAWTCTSISTSSSPIPMVFWQGLHFKLWLWKHGPQANAVEWSSEFWQMKSVTEKKPLNSTQFLTQYLRQLRFTEFTAHVLLQEAGVHHSLSQSVSIVASFSHACYWTGRNCFCHPSGPRSIRSSAKTSLLTNSDLRKAAFVPNNPSVEGYTLRNGWLCDLQGSLPNPPTCLSLWPLISSLLVSYQSAQPPPNHDCQTGCCGDPCDPVIHSFLLQSHDTLHIDMQMSQKGLHYRDPEQLPCTSFWTAISLAHQTSTLQWQSCKSRFVLR